MAVKTEECTNCGAQGEMVRGSYEFNESGLPVVLEHVELVRCAECGNVDAIIPRAGPLLDLLALAVISKTYRLNGKDVRFLRSHLGKGGEDFAGLLHVDKTVLSKWENNAIPVGEQSDRLIRLIAMNLTQSKNKDRGRGIYRGIQRYSQGVSRPNHPCRYARLFFPIYRTFEKAATDFADLTD